MTALPSSIQTAAAVAHVAGQARARDSSSAKDPSAPARRRGPDRAEFTVATVTSDQAVRRSGANTDEETREDRRARPMPEPKREPSALGDHLDLNA